MFPFVGRKNLKQLMRTARHKQFTDDLGLNVSRDMECNHSLVTQSPSLGNPQHTAPLAERGRPPSC